MQNEETVQKWQTTVYGIPTVMSCLHLNFGYKTNMHGDIIGYETDQI